MARLLTCPDCEATYRVPEEALSPHGQTVRCQRCGESWFVAGEAATPDALELADLEAAQTGGEMERVTAPAPIGARDMRAVDAPIAEAANDSLPTAGGVSAATAFRDQTHEKRRKGRVGVIRMIWIATVGLLVIAAIIAAVTRHSLVERFPQLASVFNAVGLTTSPNGLTLSDVETSYVTLDGQDFLVVRGEVVNLTGTERPAPDVRMALLDGAGEELAGWTVDVAGSVPPKGTLSYESEYPNPPLDAKRLVWEQG